MNWFKKIFGGFWNLFRSGLEKFLAENIDEAIEILKEAWNQSGQPPRLKDFKDNVFVLFSAHFREEKGTWLSILIDLAWDALKKELTKSNPQINFYK